LDRFNFVSRSRGMLLGLALGDAHAGRPTPGHGLLATSCAVQLAAFTVEGLIRASVRQWHKGICHPPAVVWYAYVRWGAAQGLDVRDAAFAAGTEDGLPGWLYQVPILGQRRGSAPATVAALQRGRGTIDEPTTDSAGAHAVVRGLVVGAFAWHDQLTDAVHTAREIGALTHGSPLGYEGAGMAAALITRAGGDDDVLSAVRGLLGDPPPRLDPAIVEAVDRGYSVATRRPADVGTLRAIGGDPSATSALAGGVYLACSFARREAVASAMHFIQTAKVPAGAAAVGGALLGSVHGVEALPIPLVSRLETAWVLDTLARDLVTELEEHPSGGEYTPPKDPHWWSRYPGF
jgi:ADP-ribosylglycohydrolase